MKGIYIKDAAGELFLNIRPVEFIEYLSGLNCPAGWLRIKIKKRKKQARNGLNFELVLIEYKNKNSANANKAANNQPGTGDDVTT